MSIFIGFLYVVEVVVCILLGMVVMIQKPKEGGLGGAIGGGGQPCLATDAVRAKRTAGIYTDDEKSTLRMSHLNPEVTALYKDYLDGKTGAQGGEKAHHLLHTKYHKRDVYHFEA
jgi:protein translocase SecG subunit